MKTETGAKQLTKSDLQPGMAGYVFFDWHKDNDYDHMEFFEVDSNVVLWLYKTSGYENISNDKKNGKVVWKFEMRDNDIASSPNVYNNIVYCINRKKVSFMRLIKKQEKKFGDVNCLESILLDRIFLMGKYIFILKLIGGN